MRLDNLCHTRRAVRALRVSCVGLAAVLAACGYGPVYRLVGVEDYSTPAKGKLTMALRHFSVFQFRGLAGLDGRTTRTLDEGLEVLVCTAENREFQQIAVLHEPQNASSSFSTSRVLYWTDSTVRLDVRGRHDATVDLPVAARARRIVPDSGRQSVVIPECAGALLELQRSLRLPDGSLATE